MNPGVFVYDPTSEDKLSKVRGIGRYLELLRESFQNEWQFVSSPPTMNNPLRSEASQQPTTLINPFFNFLQPPTITKRFAKKQIAVIHDLIPLKYPNHFPAGLKGKWVIFQNKNSLKLYDHFVTDSEASKNDIVKLLKVDPSRITVIYPVLPTSFTNPTMSETEIQFYQPETYCIYVGDATWNKNIVTIAKAVKKANVTCIFIGNVFKTHGDLNHPWQQELKRFLEEVRGDKRFIFPGFVPNNQLIKLYKQSRCNILLSQDEGFGFSYLESAFLGTPSILSDIPVFREIANDTASFVDKTDYIEAANRIEEFYFDENKRKNLSFKAQERSKYFSSEKFKNQWGRVLLP